MVSLDIAAGAIGGRGGGRGGLDELAFEQELTFARKADTALTSDVLMRFQSEGGVGGGSGWERLLVVTSFFDQWIAMRHILGAKYLTYAKQADTVY